VASSYRQHPLQVTLPLASCTSRLTASQTPYVVANTSERQRHPRPWEQALPVTNAQTAVTTSARKLRKLPHHVGQLRLPPCLFHVTTAAQQSNKRAQQLSRKKCTPSIHRPPPPNPRRRSTRARRHSHATYTSSTPPSRRRKAPSITASNTHYRRDARNFTWPVSEAAPTIIGTQPTTSHSK
jgi:hypothetical protein